MILKRKALALWAFFLSLLVAPTVALAQATGNTSTPIDPASKIGEMGDGALLLVGAIIGVIVVVGLAVLGIAGLFTAFKSTRKAMSSGT